MDASVWCRFDFVGVLRYAPYAARRASLDSELLRVGLAYHATSFWHSEDVYLMQAVERIRRTPFLAERARLAVLSLYHLQMARVALDLGAQHMLFLEDDVRFLRDTNTLERVVRDLPADYDVAFFDAFAAVRARSVAGFLEQATGERATVCLARPRTKLLRSCACYALSRRGAERFVGCLEGAARGGEALRVCDQFLGRFAVDETLATYLAWPLAAVQAFQRDSTSGADAIRAGYDALRVDRSRYMVYEGDLT